MARILYLEDDKSLGRKISDYLSFIGHKVDCYSNPDEFLNKNGELLGYGVLITNYSMPIISGIDFVVDNILEKNLIMPVLFLSDVDKKDIEALSRGYSTSRIFLLNRSVNSLEDLKFKINEILDA